MSRLLAFLEFGEQQMRTGRSACATGPMWSARLDEHVPSGLDRRPIVIFASSYKNGQG